MNPTVVGIVGLVVLILIFLTRLPIAFAMTLVGFTGFAYLVSLKGALNLLAQDVFTTFASYSMSVIPLFIFMGSVATKSGISRKLYSSAYKWIGHKPGGLAMATIGGCAAFGAVCGSLTAGIATMTTVALPEMRKYKYDYSLATGSIAAGGTLGVLIPPSIIFILYGITTEQPISKLFVAGILPGILITALFMLTIYVRCRRSPNVGPPGPVVHLREKLMSLTGCIDMLLLFALVMGGLFTGFFTPTEAGAVGAFGALLLAFLSRRISWIGLKECILDTLKATGMIFMLLYGTTIFGQFLAVTRIPIDLAEWLVSLPIPNLAILVGILIIYLLGGCFMGGLAFMLLTLPVFYPVAESLGFDPIWFGVLMVIMVELGSVTPPVGTGVYIIAGIAKDIPLEVIFKGIFPFIGAFALSLAILIAFPEIALFLPKLMGR